MTMKNLLLAAGVTSLAFSAAAGAQAQSRRASASRPAATATAPATAAATPLNSGPAIPGVCIYSNDQVLATSAVGKAFAARAQQLRAQAAAEISGEQTALQSDEKLLAGKRATLTQEQFAQQAQPLGQREQTLQQHAEQRSRELQATNQHQLQRLSEVIEPLVRTAYEAHHCSMLLNGEVIMAANPAMNISGEVTQALNAKLTTITFDRESLPTQ